MRANTGTRALVLPCPQCPTKWSTEQTLAGHLIDAHEMDLPSAVKRALEASAQVRRGRAIKDGMQRAQEETAPMANETYTCHKCGGKGHNARSPECPDRALPAAKSPPGKRCNYCHHEGHGYAECPKVKAHRAGKKRKPVTRKSQKATENGNLVAHIRRLREDVERGEAAGRELAEVRKLLEARGR